MLSCRRAELSRGSAGTSTLPQPEDDDFLAWSGPALAALPAAARQEALIARIAAWTRLARSSLVRIRDTYVLIVPSLM